MSRWATLTHYASTNYAFSTIYTYISIKFVFFQCCPCLTKHYDPRRNHKLFASSHLRIWKCLNTDEQNHLSNRIEVCCCFSTWCLIFELGSVWTQMSKNHLSNRMEVCCCFPTWCNIYKIQKQAQAHHISEIFYSVGRYSYIRQTCLRPSKLHNPSVYHV